MSIGKIEKLVIAKLAASVELIALVPEENIISTYLVHGASPEYPYMVVYYSGDNSGPFDATMVAGLLDIEVYFKQNTFDDVNTVINLIRTLLNGTVLKESGYFSQLHFQRIERVLLPETEQNIVAKKIRFQVHETY